MKNTIVKKFLKTFFSFFDAQIFEFNIQDNLVNGVIKWEDNEEQFFLYKINYNEIIFLKLIDLCDFISKHNLIQVDKIIISYDELCQLLTKNNWNENEAKFFINQLCLVNIKMIDNYEETDSFFVHF